MNGSPPWLDFSPQTFAGAAEAGRRLQQSQEQIGLEGERVGLEAQRLQQSAAQSTAQLGMESQRLAASERQAAMETQIRRETILSNFQRAQTQTAMTQAYHQAQLGIAKSRLEQEGQKLRAATQEKALALADRQNYAMFVAGGGNPAEGIAKYPRAWEPGIGTEIGRPAKPEKELQATAEIPDPANLFLNKGSVRGTPAQIWQVLGTNAPAQFQPKTAPVGTSPAATFRVAQAPAVAAPAAPVAPAAAPAGGTGVIGTPQNNQFNPAPFQIGQGPATPAAAFQAAAGKAKYSSSDDVKAAWKAGRINRDQAVQILQDQFGLE